VRLETKLDCSMTTDDGADLLTYVHPADGSVVPDEITHAALQAAVNVFTSRQIAPAAAVSSWHARDHFTQAWVTSASTRAETAQVPRMAVDDPNACQ
jgi:hypothetical protein